MRAERRDFQRMRDDLHLQLGLLDGVHGQAYPIDADRTFTCDVTCERFRNPEAQAHGTTLVLALHQHADAVYMARDDMTVEPGVDRQRTLQVDVHIGPQASERRVRERLA